MKINSAYISKLLVGVLILSAAAAASLILLRSNGISGGSKQMAVSKATPKIPEAEPREAMFYEKLQGSAARCLICFRKCVIQDGRRGFCHNKENRGGILYNIVHSLPSAVHIDPIEKEPQKHMLPGSEILCLGTAGCNYRCLHCQNSHLSQLPIDKMQYAYHLPPEAVVKLALEKNIPTISFTYNDPISLYEYVYDVAKLAKEKGLNILWHSNGSMNPEALKELLKYTDAVTIDIKGFSDKAYRNSQAELKPVLDALVIIKEKGVWLELVNLIIPTVNDSPDEIKQMCEWIAAKLGTDVPLHFSRFFPAYRLTNISPTPVETLERAHKTAQDAGLKYVTIGNMPGHKYNSTFCPECGETLIKRVHFQVLRNNIKNGKCGFCETPIPGIWE